METTEQPASSEGKPVLKVVVGGRRYYNPRDVCYVYLMRLPGRFQKLGHSTNPEAVLKVMGDQFPDEPLFVDQARAFHDRSEAMAYEKRLHRKYGPHRIVDKERRGWLSGGRYFSKRYSLEAEIYI